MSIFSCDPPQDAYYIGVGGRWPAGLEVLMMKKVAAWVRYWMTAKGPKSPYAAWY